MDNLLHNLPPIARRPALLHFLGSVLFVLVALWLAHWMGVKIAGFEYFGYFFCLIALPLIAMAGIERLTLIVFWTLPFMISPLPSLAGLTLKPPEIAAYLVATAVPLRAILRREPFAWPPASGAVLFFLAIMALSTAWEPPVPIPYVGDVAPLSRLAPGLRSSILVIWITLSWLVAVGIYNVLRSRPLLFRKCLAAHILSGGLACALSILAYLLRLKGINIVLAGHEMVFNFGYLRLCGFTDEPEYLGFYLLTVLPVTLVVRWFRPDWVSRRWCTASLVAQSIAMFLTLSAGSWAGTMAAMAVVLGLLVVPQFRRLRISRRALMQFGAGLLIIAALIGELYASNPSYASFMGEMAVKLSSGQDHFRGDERTAGYALAQSSPVLGVGPGMEGFYFPRVHPRQQSQWSGKTRDIMNLYVGTLADMGITGLFALLCAGLFGLAALAKVLRRYGPVNVPILTSLVAALVGIAVQYFALFSLTIIHFPVLAGLAFAAASVELCPRERDTPRLTTLENVPLLNA